MAESSPCRSEEIASYADLSPADRPHPYRPWCLGLCCADVRLRAGWPSRPTRLEEIYVEQKIRASVKERVRAVS